jgi:glycosyltransferase involved in cell wall biosynthesis
VHWKDALAENADTYHYHYSNSTFKTVLPLLSKPTSQNIVTIHDVLPRNIKKRQYISPALYRIINTKAKIIIVHSQSAKQLLLQEFPFISAPKIKVIPYGCFSSSPQTPNPIRQKYEISPDAVVFIYLGYIKKSKGITETINAFARTTNPNAHLILIGKSTDPDMATYLQNLHDPRIKYTGFVPYTEMHQWLDTADALVNFRHDFVGETSSSVMNMLSYHKPILATNIGSNPEIIGNAGILCTLDETQILNAYTTFIENKAYRDQLKKNAEIQSQSLLWQNLLPHYREIL